MQISDTKIGHRLAAGIALAASLLLIMIWVSNSRLSQVKEQLDTITSDRLPKIIAAKDAKDNIRARAQIVRNIVLLEDAAAMKVEADQLPALNASYLKLIDQLRATIKTPRGVAALTNAEAAVAAIAGPTERVIQLGLVTRPELR